MSIDIQDLGALGEFFGAVAVGATLIYLSIQVRLARKTTMAQIYQMRADAASLAAMLVGVSPELTTVIGKYRQQRSIIGAAAAVEQLDAHERNQLFWYMRGQLTRIDNIYYQTQEGLMDVETFHGFDTQIKLDGEAWRVLGLLEQQRPTFQTLIEKLLGEAKPPAVNGHKPD